MPSFRAPPGTRDVLPPDSTRGRALVDVFADLAGRAGFGLVVPPMFEDIGVFARIGEATDIVTKEMYDFEDKGGRRLALRPEQTASVVRVFVEQRPPTPWKVWYAGPNFRYERPQKGRWRQFDQVGVEVIGTDDVEADIEVIALGWRFYEALGLQRVRLAINSLGDADDRRRYAATLQTYLEAERASLSEQSRATLERNPLRVLDSKRAEDAAVVAGAPSTLDSLSDGAATAFERVQAGLRDLDIPFTVTPRLVRGLDYYTRTAFEYAGEALDAAQDALGGGGRYDGLAEDLGGPSAPGVGLALGVDRTLLAADAEGVFAGPPSPVDVFVVDVAGGAAATVLCDELRRAGIGVERAYDGRSMKAQMKKAGASGAQWAVIVGEDELAAGDVVLRDLQTSEQRRVPREKLVDELQGARA